MTNSNRFGLASLLAIALLPSCTEPVGVSVDCETVESGVDCDVKETKGKAEAKACWDFTVECDDGVKVEAPNTCATVKDGKSEKVNIPMDKLKNRDKCKKANKGTVSKLTINGKDAK